MTKFKVLAALSLSSLFIAAMIGIGIVVLASNPAVADPQYQPGQPVPRLLACGPQYNTAHGARVTCLSKANPPYLLTQIDADPKTRTIKESYLYTPRFGVGSVTYRKARENWGVPQTVTHSNALTIVRFRNAKVEFVANPLTDDSVADIIIYEGPNP